MQKDNNMQRDGLAFRNIHRLYKCSFMFERNERQGRRIIRIVAVLRRLAGKSTVLVFIPSCVVIVVVIPSGAISLVLPCHSLPCSYLDRCASKVLE